ncbi:SpoIIE family protein phosphatase [Streptomyces sp. NPDC054950]
MSRVWDIPVHDSTRVRDVHVAAESASAHAGLSPHRTAVAALVATELATNLLKHAGGGRIVINLVERVPAGANAVRSSVQLLSLDHGPGITDIAVALGDGYTTAAAASLGAGLGTCLRISNDFDLHSAPGRGTVAAARIGHEPASRHVPKHRPTGPRAGGVNVSLARAEYSGDAWSWARSGSQVTLMLCDGLGHGTKAAEASSAAVEELHRAAHLPPAELLRRLHTRLRATRGAAVAVAQLDTDAGQLAFAGVGNIGARLHTADGWQPFLSHPGIVGAHFPATVPVQRALWGPRGLLVLHSDGLPSRWTPPDDALLLARDPAVVAAAVLRDAGSDARPVRDDTSVAVLAPDDRIQRP